MAPRHRRNASSLLSSAGGSCNYVTKQLLARSVFCRVDFYYDELCRIGMDNKIMERNTFGSCNLTLDNNRLFIVYNRF